MLKQTTMNIDKYLDISQINELVPEKGRLLIAEPFMEDNFFKRSVVYLCEHNEDGSFGFVLNNPLSVSLSELIEDFDVDGYPVNFGGPVNSSNLYFLHTLGSRLAGSIEVSDGIYTGGNFEELKPMMKTGLVSPEEIRFFMGYSGWEADQLQNEMEINSWLIGEAQTIDVIGNTDKTFWRDTLNKMGGKFKMISNFPEDPTLN